AAPSSACSVLAFCNGWSRDNWGHLAEISARCIARLKMLHNCEPSGKFSQGHRHRPLNALANLVGTLPTFSKKFIRKPPNFLGLLPNGLGVGRHPHPDHDKAAGAAASEIFIRPDSDRRANRP